MLPVFIIVTYFLKLKKTALATTSEEKLVQLCKVGDPAAQQQLYHRYANAMINVAYRILKNKEDAQEVLQDAFLKAFKKVNTLENTAGFAGWLKKIVIHTAINKAKKKGFSFVEMKEHFMDQPNDEIVSEQQINWNIQLVKKALMQLPNGYRTVLTLYLIEGYAHDEIATILNISKATSLTQYSRGKQKLKLIFQQLEKDGTY